MKTKELNKQIKELKEKSKLQNTVEEKLSFIDPEKIGTSLFNYKKRGTKYHIWVDLHSEGYPFNKKGVPLSELRDVIKKTISAFPPSKLATIYTAGKDVPTKSNFVLKWDNSCTGRYKASIEWVSGVYDIDINVPIGFYSDDVKGVFMRSVTDSEYHYFPGMSHAELRRMQFRAYRLDMFEKIQYYGGSVTNYINDQDQVKEFEHVILNGHIEKYADFWQTQLIELSKT